MGDDITQSELALQRKIDKTTDPDEKAGLELQLLVARQWLIWVKKYRSQPQVMLKALSMHIATLISEAFFNVARHSTIDPADASIENMLHGIQLMINSVSEYSKLYYLEQVHAEATGGPSEDQGMTVNLADLDKPNNKH
jgi:hypothetical protein